TGYRGRDVIMELLEPTGEFWRLLEEDVSEQTLVNACPKNFKTLKDDGFQRIMEGVTGLAEIDRVVMG
ncbi:secretion system protein E, partial [bacterium]|nr:secretion system protein E [candidate division CSSED10-310 bacterium]